LRDERRDKCETEVQEIAKYKWDNSKEADERNL
jgi:hypothetical protein